MAKYEQRVGSDRFGNPQIIKSTRAAKGKNKELIDAIQVCWVELGGKTYKISVTDIKKDSEKIAERGGKYWVTVTKQDSIRKHTSM